MRAFDAGLLESMLRVFYPTASPAALRLARLERPEYFAGAQLVPERPGELVLDDGRTVRCLDVIDQAIVGWRVRLWPMISPTSPVP